MGKRKLRISAPKNRALKRPAKNVGANPRARRELEKIEQTLGEEFSSLKEARAALKAETKPRKNSYTVKELSSRKNKTIGDFLTDLEAHRDDIDELKDADDYWAVGIQDRNGRVHHTWKLFNNTNSMIRQLEKYEGLKSESTKLLNKIEIIRVHGRSAMDEYFASKHKEKQDSVARMRARKKQDRKRARQWDKKEKALKQQIKKLRAKLKAKK